MMVPFPCRSRRGQGQIVRRVCEALEAEYGRPRLGNPLRPLDDLFFVILSNRTAPATARPTFRSLKRRYPRWSMLAEARATEVAKVLRPAGLSVKKARQMCGIARRLVRDFGRCSLAPVKALSDDNALAYLRSLPGVSTKVAYCVMIYGMGRDVLPVDVHVHRVCRRLGWVDRKRADQSHEALARLVARHRRYAFHVDCVLHGRAICTARAPVCHACPIDGYCDHARGGSNGSGA